MNYRKQTWRFVLITLLLAMAVAGCKKKVEPPPPPPPPPAKAATATISVSPSSIQPGQSATLTWSTENAKTVTVQGVTVAASGTQTVSPTQSTDYQVAAQGDPGTPEATNTARLTVTAPPPPPPPPPPPHQPSDDEIFSQGVHDIHFDYDKYDVRADDQASLTQTAQTISQHPNWVVLIEGNCDERGSTEYNIGLGGNRSTSARDFLVKAGVNPNQLKTHSNGKEKPVCNEGNEDCWQRNRNDHFSLQH
ncbi:MAG TPA: OmpA family protein [Candidatus Saccharimonadales bacterium]|nr:OmpA family protein [Candidatus Saccharimonadales bacterium]